MKSGIYKYQNIIDGKLYIGSAVDFIDRWNVHKYALKNQKHHSSRLQNAVNKYGIENFEFKILEEVEPIKKKLLEREQYYLDFYKSYEEDKGYNIARATRSPMFGRNHTKETRNHLSKVRKGEIHSLEHNLKVSRALKGKMPTQTHMEKLWTGTRGRKQSISEIEKRRSSLTGLKRSKEAIKNLSNAHLGNKYALGAKRSQNYREITRQNSLAQWKRYREEFGKYILCACDCNESFYVRPSENKKKFKDINHYYKFIKD